MGAGGNAAGARAKLKTLFTREDKGHVHKMLGLFALLHFIGRFAQAGAADMGFGATDATLACIGAHAALSATSLIFRIPTKRIVEGSRIWPEYRLHSIVFAYRSIACMLLVWFERRLGAAQPLYAANGAIVVATLLAADFGSWWVGPAGRSSTIQDLDAPPFMRFFFTVMQFHATAGCLLGVRRFSTQFAYVWIIQFTAFLMTLRRKNIAPHGPLVTTYGVMLTLGALVSLYDHATAGLFLAHNILAHSACMLRLGLRVPKYLLWTGLAVAVHVARPYLALTDADPLQPRLALWAASTASVGVLGARKMRRYADPLAQKAAAAAAADHKAS